MKIEDLDVFKNDSLSPMEKAKLKIVVVFFEKLPSQEMKKALLELIEAQPFMEPGEFHMRLDDFAAQTRNIWTGSEDDVQSQNAVQRRLH